MNFDFARFIESFAASVLGDATHDSIKRNWDASESEIETVRVFQRSFIISVEGGAIDKKTATKYLRRLTELPRWQRIGYLRKIRQPPTGPASESDTAVVICHHALMSDQDWILFVEAIGVNKEHPIKAVADFLSETVDALEDYSERHQNNITGEANILLKENPFSWDNLVNGVDYWFRKGQTGFVTSKIVEFKSSLGVQSIETKNIQKIQFYGTFSRYLFPRKAKLVLTDGSRLGGTMLTGSVDITFAAMGNSKLQFSRIYMITGIKTVSQVRDVAPKY